MWTTIVAKFASPCRRCGGQIKVGQKFRYGRLPNMKSGVGYHLKADCPSPDATKQPAPNAEPASPDATKQPAPNAEPASPDAAPPAGPLTPEEQATLERLLARSAASAE